jgi:hypothetical protein
LPVIFSQAGIRNRVAFQWRAPRPGQPQYSGSSKWEGYMHREDLMNPDLLSEIVLLGSGALLFVFLLLIVLTAITRA